VLTLFTKIASEEKPEVINMNQLFNSKNVKWNGQEYEEFPDEIETDLIDDSYDEDDDDTEEYYDM
jgi:hypothetical protein